jgi:hypothetical protein
MAGLSRFQALPVFPHMSPDLAVARALRATARRSAGISRVARELKPPAMIPAGQRRRPRHGGVSASSARCGYLRRTKRDTGSTMPSRIRPEDQIPRLRRSRWCPGWPKMSLAVKVTTFARLSIVAPGAIRDLPSHAASPGRQMAGVRCWPDTVRAPGRASGGTHSLRTRTRNPGGSAQTFSWPGSPRCRPAWHRETTAHPEALR